MEKHKLTEQIKKERAKRKMKRAFKVLGITLGIGIFVLGASKALFLVEELLALYIGAIAPAAFIALLVVGFGIYAGIKITGKKDD